MLSSRRLLSILTEDKDRTMRCVNGRERDGWLYCRRTIWSELLPLRWLQQSLPSPLSKVPSQCLVCSSSHVAIYKWFGESKWRVQINESTAAHWRGFYLSGYYRFKFPKPQRLVYIPLLSHIQKLWCFTRRGVLWDFIIPGTKKAINTTTHIRIFMYCVRSKTFLTKLSTLVAKLWQLQSCNKQSFIFVMILFLWKIHEHTHSFHTIAYLII
jgi:hypothetical protein